MFEIGAQLFGPGHGARIIAPLLYGISTGGIATALYIRMYMMLSFLGLLFIYLIFRLMEEEGSRAGIPNPWRPVEKGSFSGVRRADRGVSGGLIFPASLNHIFMGEKGQESLGNVFHGGRVFLERLERYGEIVGEEFFCHEKGFWWAAVGVAMMLTGTFLMKIHKKCPDREKHAFSDARFWILTASLAGYFLLIVQISTDVADRYQFLICPVGILVLVAAVFRFFRQARLERATEILGAMAVLLRILSFDGESIPYIYPGYEAARQSLAGVYRDSSGIYVTAGDHLVINNSLFLAQQSGTYPVRAEDLDTLPGICGGNGGGSSHSLCGYLF